MYLRWLHVSEVAACVCIASKYHENDEMTVMSVLMTVMFLLNGN